jgi:Domain of unknown function (DUF4349)
MRNPILLVAEKWRGWNRVQRTLVVVGTAGLCLMLVATATHAPKVPMKAAATFPPMEYQTQYALAPGAEPMSAIDENGLKQLQAEAAMTRDAARKELARNDDLRIGQGSPLIAHTAELAVTTKEFGRSRISLEEILERHRGYAAKLRMVGQKSGSVLSATLRVPSTELTGTVSALKSLGDVEREEQAADEITQQRADLEARMTNAQNTLRRLQGATAADRQRERGSGAAGRRAASFGASRDFCERFFTLREEMAESLGAQLRSAATAGFGDAMASLAGLLAFLIGRGPVVVLWCTILYVPARFVWKKWAPVTAQPSAVQGD